jgi:uncharacterized membrane protein
VTSPARPRREHGRRNVFMLQAMEQGALTTALAVRWVRLPLQPLLVWWVWKAGTRRG